MPDPALLLLACTTCTGKAPVASVAVQLAKKNCIPNQSPNPCVSPPEFQGDRQLFVSLSAVQFTATSPEFATPQDPFRGIALGSQGKAVIHLQTRLQALGYYQGAIDGLYGPATEAAVTQFQQSQGLGMDGIAGENTWKALQGRKVLSSSSPLLLLTLSGDLSISPSSSFLPRSPLPPHRQSLPSELEDTQAIASLPWFWWLGGMVILTVAGGSWVMVDRKWLDDPLHEVLPSDGAVVLQPSPVWLQGMVWTLVGLIGFGVLWACTAEIDESVPAQGQLKPQAEVKPVQVPIAGVVQQIHVREGDSVQPGDLLVTLDQGVAKAQLASLRQIRQSLIQENQFYRQQLLKPVGNPPTLVRTPVSLEWQGLLQNRATLLAENTLLKAQVEESIPDTLTIEQQSRLAAMQSELQSRVIAAEKVIGQQEKRRNQIDVQIASVRTSLATDQNILTGLDPLVREGAIARIPYLRQEQQVNTQQAEIKRLHQERTQVELAIAQARAELENTITTTRRDLYAQIAANNKQIAEIESQISKAIVENSKRIAELDSQISQVRQTLRYQDVRATVAGVIFDLKAKAPGFVANSNEPILKIVPQTDLLAEVFVTNRDLGFVHPQMPVAIRVESFPYTEYGELQGELVTVGADALPPDPTYPFYRFPATIRLRRQTLQVGDRVIPLQSGMAVNTHIKVRRRKVMTLVTDLLTQKVDSLSTVR